MIRNVAVLLDFTERRVYPQTILLKLRTIQIVVISGDTGNDVMYKGIITRPRKIFLYLKDNHNHSITSINGFFVNSKICNHCFEYITRIENMVSVCRTCSENSMFDNTSIEYCNMMCRNALCCERHIKTKTV